jgi:hypothetical protein
MARRKNKGTGPGICNEMTPRHPQSQYKKNDCLWFKDYCGEWRWGSLSYFSKTPEGKEWVTLWDMSEGGFYSCDIDGLQENAPDTKTERRVKRIAKKNKAGGAK